MAKVKEKNKNKRLKRIWEKELISKYINIPSSQCLKDIIVRFENFTCIPNICETIDGIHIPLADLPNKRVKLVIDDFFNNIP